MKKLLILRSVTKTARKYADQHFKHFTFFDDPEIALKNLKTQKKNDRPWFVVVDAGTGMKSAALQAQAMGLGYVVQTRGVT